MHERFHCQCKYDYFICVTILSNSSLNFPCIHNMLRIFKILEGKRDFKMMAKKNQNHFLSSQANWPLPSPDPAHMECALQPQALNTGLPVNKEHPNSPPGGTVLTWLSKNVSITAEWLHRKEEIKLQPNLAVLSAPPRLAPCRGARTQSQASSSGSMAHTVWAQ